MTKKTIMEQLAEADSGGQTLPDFTDFIKEFNALKYGYRACLNKRGGVDIVSNQDGELMASLLPHSKVWFFKESAFYSYELALMANLSATLLSATLPMFRNPKEENDAEN